VLANIDSFHLIAVTTQFNAAQKLPIVRLRLAVTITQPLPPICLLSTGVPRGSSAHFAR
jgi:hypothetical protein